jgi:putative oxidoreductase
VLDGTVIAGLHTCSNTGYVKQISERDMMDRILGKYEPYFYALLRIVAGVMFMMHGTQKMLGWPAGEHGGGVMDATTIIAGTIELIGGAMITVGFFAGTAAFLASGLMAVAFFMVHVAKSPLPILNGGELPVLYSFLWLYVAARGSGVWSVDEAIAHARVHDYGRGSVQYPNSVNARLRKGL